MKLINTINGITVSLAFFCLATGCSDEMGIDGRIPSLEGSYLKVPVQKFEFGSAGDAVGTGKVESSHAWSIQGLPDWLSATPDSGEGNQSSETEFKLTASENKSLQSRVAVSYIRSESKNLIRIRELTVTQVGASPYVQVDDGLTEMRIDGKKQTVSVKITTNVSEPYVEFSEEWGAASYDSAIGMINLEVEEYGALKDSSPRTGYINIYQDPEHTSSMLKSLKVEQNVAKIQLGETMVFDVDGGTESRKITSDVDWTANVGTATWFTISPEFGTQGETVMTVTVLPSYQKGRRDAHIRLYCGENLVNYLMVRQFGVLLEATQSTVNFNAEGIADSKINLTANIKWEITSKPEWIEATPMNGSGYSTIEITASKNMSLSPRSGSIVFSDARGGDMKCTVNVNQAALDLGDDPTIEFGWQASSQSLNIPFPDNWQAAVSDGWITVSEYLGKGEKTIQVMASRNDSEGPRTGTIAITSEGKTFNVIVVQKGQYIHIDTPPSTVSAMGGGINLQVSTTVTVTPSIEYDGSVTDWITYEKVGEDNYDLKISYNPSGLDRTATFVLTPAESDVADTWTSGVKMKITQSGRQLSCSVYKIESGASGGTSETYLVTADGGYTIGKQPGDDWYTLVNDPEHDMFYIVVTNNTMDSDRSGRIVMSLTDLPEGEYVVKEIEVFQHKKGIYVSFDDFEEDTIW